MQDDNLFERNYRRGAVMGLTLAEAFILIAFALLLLFAFWHWEREKKHTPEWQAFNERPYEERLLIVSALNDGSLGALEALQQKGIGPGELDQMAGSLSLPPLPGELQDKWRFIDQDDVRRLLDSVSSLPPDVQRDLADLVDDDDAHAALSKMAILEELVQSGQEIEDLREMFAGMQEAGQSLANIANRIEQDEGQRRALVSALRSELGGVVSEAGGKIDDSGAIILPDSVLFEKGEAEITPMLAKFLEDICKPWLTELRDSSVEISEVKIEGHASSEWGTNSTPHQAYLRNLDLSQRRSQAVLRECLEIVRKTDVHEWAQSRMIAVGYSSVRPVLRNGQEDRAASRRVVFSATRDREPLIQELGTEAKTAVPDRSTLEN